MTEADWLAADDPQPMLAYLRDRDRGVSDRKLRLFAVACCRRVWYRLTAESSREAVETAERYADDGADTAALMGAFEAAYQDTVNPADFAAAHAAEGSIEIPAALVASFAADEVRPDAFAPDARHSETMAQAALLHDIFGNPFRPAPAIDPAVLAYNGGTVPKLAAAIYDNRAFDRLPVLADALEDAGCADAAVLGHCRSGGEHVRGCWVLDSILSKW